MESSVARYDVVDFVAVRAQAIDKDQQSQIAALTIFNSKHLKAMEFNRFQ
jgi:hypothetical protein